MLSKRIVATALTVACAAALSTTARVSAIGTNGTQVEYVAKSEEAAIDRTVAYWRAYFVSFVLSQL